ncbi:MAG: hypothetical protein GYB66_11925 [Chloroflexi bacterium]|nr:hypothetical protein [Chloroflexota bacterium]
MNSEEKQDVPQLLTAEALRKANFIGLGILVSFAISAGIVYLLTGLIGWDSTAARIIVALLVGPLVIMVGFGLWWLAGRAAEDELPPRPEHGTKEGQHDE